MIAKFFILGALSANLGTGRWYPESTVTLKRVYFSLGTAPVGGAEIDVKKNGASIFPSNRPSCSAGAFKSTSVAVDVTLTSEEYLTVDVVTAGGSNATVCIVYS